MTPCIPNFFICYQADISQHTWNVPNSRQGSVIIGKVNVKAMTCLVLRVLKVWDVEERWGHRDSGQHPSVLSKYPQMTTYARVSVKESPKSSSRERVGIPGHYSSPATRATSGDQEHPAGWCRQSVLSHNKASGQEAELRSGMATQGKEQTHILPHGTHQARTYRIFGHLTLKHKTKQIITNIWLRTI